MGPLADQRSPRGQGASAPSSEACAPAAGGARDFALADHVTSATGAAGSGARARSKAAADEVVIDAEPASAPPLPRRQLGPYEIIAEIARGGMGVVYLCRRAGEAGFERLFAIKEMHEHLAHDHDFVAMLLDEGRLAARIHHHNVASVVELGRGAHGYYLVMPYIEGCSLDHLLAKNPAFRPPDLIVPILIGALSGLAAAHALEDDDGAPLGLVHRDVSPQNILVGIDGDARITDFGIAKARARISSTEPGVLKGKLCYCAPEILDRSFRVDHRADQFAAGAVLWSALTGRSLFRGATDAETVQRIFTLEVPAPSKVGLAPPAVFDEIILRALARDPARRYPSAAAMADALRETALAAGMLGAPTRVARWVRETFADALAERQRQLRLAARHPANSQIAILPNLAADAATPAAPAALAVSAPPEATAMDIARFLGALALAFGAGTVAALWARGLL